MTTLIKVPFAQSGDKTIPPVTDPAGGVNWTQGYPTAYSKDPATDPSAKRIEREMFNGILFQLSKAISEIQTTGVSPFISSADNGGTPYAYGIGSIVWYNNTLWRSLIDANTTTPAEGSNWSKVIASKDLGSAAFSNIGKTVASNEIPSMLQWGAVRAGTGWIRFPNDVLLQWGANTAAAQGNTGGVGNSVNFPIAFSNECYQVFTSYDNGSIAIPAGATGSFTKTSFLLRCSATSGNYNFRYFAVGV